MGIKNLLRFGEIKSSKGLARKGKKESKQVRKGVPELSVLEQKIKQDIAKGEEPEFEKDIKRQTETIKDTAEGLDTIEHNNNVIMYRELQELNTLYNLFKTKASNIKNNKDLEEALNILEKVFPKVKGMLGRGEAEARALRHNRENFAKFFTLKTRRGLTRELRRFQSYIKSHVKPVDTLYKKLKDSVDHIEKLDKNDLKEVSKTLRDFETRTLELSQKIRAVEKDAEILTFDVMDFLGNTNNLLEEAHKRGLRDSVYVPLHQNVLGLFSYIDQQNKKAAIEAKSLSRAA
ncbi:hypothetical protein GOV05_00810 [Candidatus Woesearchaeota archaeon]|nr:hypothetical protein [Candidatus Woesearchaeota archaeon]